MRTSELIQRIKVSYNFIRYGKGNVRLMTCGKCGGVFIHPISESPQEGEIITDQRHIDRYWVEFHQCMKCGAVCEETQYQSCKKMRRLYAGHKTRQRAYERALRPER